MSKYDLVVYGATGFTGRLVAEYLAGGRAAAAGVRWAVAGRDPGKVSALAASLGAGVGALSGDPSAIAARARVVLTTAGPYARIGEPMLAACVAAGADYADLTGETPWAAEMIDAYESSARAKGVTVINMSGFDSIPADACVFAAADAARKQLHAGLVTARGFFRGAAGVSGGTIASGLGVLARPALAERARDPFLMFPAAAVASAGTGSAATLISPVPDRRQPFWVPEIGAAAAPFVMAAINTRVVRRSAGLLAAHSASLAGHTHSLALLPAGAATAPSAAPSATYAPRSPFAFSEYMLIGGGRLLGLAGAWFAYAMLALDCLLPALLALPGAARLLAVLLPAPGTGPSAAQRAASRWQYTLLADCDDAPRSAVAVRASGKCPGYGDTAKMLAEVGILLATERAALPAAKIGGGFLTPAVALGRRLPEILNEHAGIKLQVLYAGPSPVPAAALRGR